jgi:hypothetical protein
MMHIMVSLAFLASLSHHAYWIPNRKGKKQHILSHIQWITGFKINRSPFGNLILFKDMSGVRTLSAWTGGWTLIKLRTPTHLFCSADAVAELCSAIYHFAYCRDPEWKIPIPTPVKLTSPFPRRGYDQL